MIDYTWDCSTVDVYPSKKNTVYNVHYIVTGEDSENQATFIGTQELDTKDIIDFKPFDEVTHDTVVEWCQDAIGDKGVKLIQENIAKQIEEIKNPTTVTLKIEK